MVQDLVTGLTWQRSPDTNGDGRIDYADKLSWEDARVLPDVLNSLRFAGYDDWRLPTIKELYSLFDARGVDPSGPGTVELSRVRPFLDPDVFVFGYGDTAHGERVIDAQYISSTRYAGRGIRGANKVFGVNFADGRIKGYDLSMPGRREKRFYVICVRGNPRYGQNMFRDCGDGTILDLATGLMWSKEDSGRGMTWPEALTWVQRKNEEGFLGYRDWRLPNIKELQSIVDYSRCPDVHNAPALDPVFDCTPITNEVGERDFPYFWSSTTHVSLRGGQDAMYIAFGRAAGWVQVQGGLPGPRGDAFAGRGPAGRPRLLRPRVIYADVHGAGAQRSDPKVGDPRWFPLGRGPQNDVVRIRNFVRLVRGPLRNVCEQIRP